MSLSTDLRNRLGYALTSTVAAAELADALDAARVALSGDVVTTALNVATIQAAAVTLPKINPNSIDGTIAKNVGTVGDVIAGLTLTRIITVADASADTDTLLTFKERIIKFEFLNTGIGAHATLDTVQLKNVATAITDAVAKTATVNALVKAATYDPAQVVVAAGAILRITAVKNTNVAGIAIVTSVRSA